jgi:hypothetical protein
MLGLVKMSALSAVLSFGVVQAYDRAVSPMDGAPSTKVFHDRIEPGTGGAAKLVSADGPARSGTAGRTEGKGDRIAVVPTNCAGQEWPYISADCLTRDDGHAKPARVRLITVEHREGANVSVLQRVQPTSVANR